MNNMFLHIWKKEKSMDWSESFSESRSFIRSCSVSIGMIGMEGREMASWQSYWH
jgi:hypothetical protein